VAQRLLKAMAKPFLIEGQELFLTASIGIAIFPHDSEEPEGLLRCATTALAHAKDCGRNSYRFYSSELNASSAERLALTSDLWKALDRDELVLWYQPKVDIAKGTICSAEALIRWQHPELGLLFPDTFIPLAEEGGLIGTLGEWVIREAARQHERWREEGLGSIRISVNVSGDQFADSGLPAIVLDALQEANSGPEALCVEMTESVVMRDAETSILCLEALREMGIRLSIDDFGTGYSSLSYLKRLPIDELKIDRSFVQDLHRDENDRAIAKVIIAMAHTLGLSVVAEGVEIPEHLEFLRSQGCEQYQGYLFSRPVPPDVFAGLLDASHHPASAAGS
jgi:EAL domain-containing protein (putative c-di-GMP-specific phosphodiesterase class I)